MYRPPLESLCLDYLALNHLQHPLQLHSNRHLLHRLLAPSSSEMYVRASRNYGTLAFPNDCYHVHLHLEHYCFDRHHVHRSHLLNVHLEGSAR